MPAALIASAFFAEGTFAYAATTFAIRLATTYAIASLLRPNQPSVGSGTAGGEIQLGPATDNKIPVVYGSTYVQPVVTDAIISSDQQTMWYVLSFSETTDSGDIHFEEVWYDGKLLLFDGNADGNPNEILGWWTRPKKNSKIGGTIEVAPAGKVAMYFYKNGSAVPTQHRAYDNSAGFANITDNLQTTGLDARTVLQDSSIPDQLKWINNDAMSNTVFAILRLNYDSNAGVHGLGQIQARIVNTLTAPGDVITDYLVNTRYGAGVPITNINTATLSSLNTISAAGLSITDTLGQNVSNNFTYEINGIIDTTKDCLTNLNDMTEACDSWLQWDERLGKWGVIPNLSLFQAGQTTATMTVINSNNIIGGINITPTDLKSSANKITVAFPNSDIIGQTDYRYYWLEDQFKSPNEPENNVDINYPLVNNSFQATYLGYRKLWMGRQDLVINFTMDYSGIHLNAGDIVAINHEWYGWGPGTYNNLTCSGKPFRVTQIKEAKDTSGFLSVQITAMSYNDSIYTTMNPHYYTPDEFGLLTNTNYISKPDAPIIPPAGVNTTASFYTVQANIPTSGNINAMEFWYSETTSTFVSNNYVLYSTQYYNGGSLYPHYLDDGVTVQIEQSRASGLPQGIYWWRTRAVGPNTTSEYSDASDSFLWSGGIAGGGGVSGQQILDNSISGSKVVQGNAATNGGSQSQSFFDTLGPLALGSLGLAAMQYGWKQGIFNDILPTDWQPKGGGNDAGDIPIEPSTTILYADGTPVSNPQVGDSIFYVADATPPQPLPSYTYAQTGYNDYPSVDTGDSSFSDWV